MAAIARIAEILENYRGRDRIIRLTAYSCCFLGGALKNSKYKAFAQSLSILSENLNECRTVLRLFDDLSMLLHCKRFGLGSKEKDSFLQITTLVDNLLGQAYYPIEHIAWAQDRKILTGNSSRLWILGILLWLGSLCISIVQSLWLLKNLRKKESDVDRRLGELQAVHSQKLNWYHVKRRQLVVTLIGSVADVGNAVHWLPGGFLWSGMLSQLVVGLLGTISSASMLYNYMNPVYPKNTESVTKDS